MIGTRSLLYYSLPQRVFVECLLNARRSLDSECAVVSGAESLLPGACGPGGEHADLHSLVSVSRFDCEERYSWGGAPTAAGIAAGEDGQGRRLRGDVGGGMCAVRGRAMQMSQLWLCA